MGQKGRQVEMEPTSVTDKAALSTNFGDTGRWVSYRVPELEGLPMRGVSLSYQVWQSPVSWVLPEGGQHPRGKGFTWPACVPDSRTPLLTPFVGWVRDQDFESLPRTEVRGGVSLAPV